MNGPSIILNPKLMFQTLEELEQDSENIISKLTYFVAFLNEVSGFTYAIGCGLLVKKAEVDLNQVGNAVVEATNSINIACKEVVNQLVNKFASEGARSDYIAPAFNQAHIKENTADRAAIYLQKIEETLDFMERNIIPDYKHGYEKLQQTYESTKKFWSGNSADQTRLAFKTRVLPKLKELLQVLLQIIYKGQEWIEETVKSEASLLVN